MCVDVDSLCWERSRRNSDEKKELKNRECLGLFSIEDDQSWCWFFVMEKHRKFIYNGAIFQENWTTLKAFFGSKYWSFVETFQFVGEREKERGRIPGIRCVLARTASNFGRKRYFCRISTRVWPTDGRKDTPSYRDARTHLKK